MSGHPRLAFDGHLLYNDKQMRKQFKSKTLGFQPGEDWAVHSFRSNFNMSKNI